MKNSTTQTSSVGVVSAEKSYDAFGNVVSASGVWKSQFGYAGKFGYQSDPDTGLKLLGHRYYDSDTGRFLTRDPIKDGRNWYSYCDNNPVSYFDAEGLKKTLLIVVGDTKGSAGLIWLYFWNVLLPQLKKMYGDEYDIVIMVAPTAEEVREASLSADAIVLYGHGSAGEDGGTFYLQASSSKKDKKNSTKKKGEGGDTLQVNDINLMVKARKKKRKKKLDFILVLACDTFQDDDWVEALLDLAEVAIGYDELTYDPSKGVLRVPEPKIERNGG